MGGLHLNLSFAGSRILRDLLDTDGRTIGRCHVATPMKRLRIEALCRKPNTSKPDPGHKIYSSLLRGRNYPGGIRADAECKLLSRQSAIAQQAHIIVGASAKAGIRGLVYALAGYNLSSEELIAAFGHYVLEEARKYEPEFPNEIYIQWHRLYEILVPVRGKTWHFKHLTVRHIYSTSQNSLSPEVLPLRATAQREFCERLLPSASSERRQYT